MAVWHRSLQALEEAVWMALGEDKNISTYSREVYRYILDAYR